MRYPAYLEYIYVIILLRSAPHLKGSSVYLRRTPQKEIRPAAAKNNRTHGVFGQRAPDSLFSKAVHVNTRAYRAAFRQQKIHSVCFY